MARKSMYDLEQVDADDDFIQVNAQRLKL